MNQQTLLDPIHKSVTVDVPPAEAFDFYVSDAHEWWPLTTHSVGQRDAVSVTFGKAVGEPIVETLADGSTHEWGTITVFDRPHRLAHTWHAGTPESEATDVEVTFVADGDHGTRVELVHAGWDRRQGDAVAIRAGYNEGWDVVLGAYAGHA